MTGETLTAHKPESLVGTAPVKNPTCSGMSAEMAQRIQATVEQAPSPEIAEVWALVQEQLPELRDVHHIIQKASCFHGGKIITPQTEEEDVYFEFTDVASEVIERLMQHRRKSVELCARDLGMEMGALTPRLLKVFIFLHEVGHVHDYLTHFLQPILESGCVNPKTTATAQYWERTEQEFASLPIPNGAPGGLAMWSGIPEIFWDAVKRKMPLGIIPPELATMSPAEIVALQEQAYKATRGERIADRFAADFIRKNNLTAHFS